MGVPMPYLDELTMIKERAITKTLSSYQNNYSSEPFKHYHPKKNEP